MGQREKGDQLEREEKAIKVQKETQDLEVHKGPQVTWLVLKVLAVYQVEMVQLVLKVCLCIEISLHIY